jgi:hypothetical protein
MSYQPSYPNAKRANTFEEGMEFQDFVCTQLAKRGLLIQYYSSKKYQFERGENVQGVEVKLDNLCTKSGRLSIEIAEKSKANNLSYVPSGIYREDNTWLYAHGNYEYLWVFAKTTLKNLHVTGRYQEHDKLTIKTFYIPIADATKYAALVMDFRTEQTVSIVGKGR